MGSHRLDCHDAYMLFDLLDRHGLDHVDIYEFILGCMRLKGDSRSIDVSYLVKENERLSADMGFLVDTLHQNMCEVKELLNRVLAQNKVMAHTGGSLQDSI